MNTSPSGPAGDRRPSSARLRADFRCAHDASTSTTRTARRRLRCTGDEGVAMGEFALVFPLFIGLVLGMISSGITYNQKIQLTHATREAARYGATVSAGDAFTDQTKSWAQQISAVALTRSAGDLNVAGAALCVSLVEGSGPNGVTVVSTSQHPSTWYTTNGSAPCDATETYPTTLQDVGRRVQVRVSRPAKIETGFMAWNITLTANATVRSESSS
jgi:Flp pilus assembly protein TadG